MSDTHLLSIIRLAVTQAGYVDRGILDPAALRDELRQVMSRYDVPEERLPDVEALVDAFVGFASHVRAAERKRRPILNVLGEIDPPPK